MPFRFNAKRAPIAKRVYLTGNRLSGYRIVVKDNAAEREIYLMDAPSYSAGNAMVRALRELEAARGTIF